MRTVIIADDEHLIKQSLSKIINEYAPGLQVVGLANDGKEALELIESLSPSILITDINMPVMDGLELIAELKQRQQPIEIIVVSGYDEFEYVHSALRHGVTDYWLKPIKTEKVLDTLQLIGQKWQAAIQTIRTRSERLPTSRAAAQQLAESLWTLNEAGAEDQLAAIEAHALELQDTDYTPGQYYMDILVFLDEEMERLSGTTMSFKAERELDWNKPSDLLAAQLAHAVAKRNGDIRSSRNFGYKKQITKAVAYMDAHYADDKLTLQSIAEFAGMSPTYFSRIFKEMMGVSFIQYLIELRLETAKRLLGDSTLKTYEIAIEVGYTDYPHFAKAFKKHVGLSPSEYQRNMRM